MPTTVQIIKEDGDRRLVVTKTTVETAVYEQNPNRMYSRVPLGACRCPEGAFQGSTYETSLEIGLDALINVGIVGRPLVTYCFGEHIEVTYDKDNCVADEDSRGERGAVLRRGKQVTAYICTNQTPPVLLSLVTPKEGRYCHPEILSHIRTQNPAVLLTRVRPSVYGNGTRINAMPLIRSKHEID